MKKKFLALFMCGILCLGSMAGCGKETPAEPSEPVVVEPTKRPMPTVAPAMSENVVPTEVEEEPTPTEAEETPKADFVGTLTAPEGYEDYTYGKAPLSSVYLFLEYAYLLAPGEETLEEMGLGEGMSPEEYIAALDESMKLMSEADEDKEEERNQLLILALGLSGLTDGSDAQVDGFFDGTWVPDGTDYLADLRQEDGSIDWGNGVTSGPSEGDDEKERENATEFKIGRDTYKSWREIEVHNRKGLLTIQVYSVDGSPLELDTEALTAEYKGKLKIKITEAKWQHTIAEDRIDLIITFEVSANEADDAVVMADDFVIK